MMAGGYQFRKIRFLSMGGMFQYYILLFGQRLRASQKLNLFPAMEQRRGKLVLIPSCQYGRRYQQLLFLRLP